MPSNTEAVQGLVDGTREFLRDFPTFFETDLGVVDVSTVRLPHPLVSAEALQVVAQDGVEMFPVPSAAMMLDQRNGLLKFMDEAYLGKRVVANGYHYSWFLDADLAFHARRTLLDVSYGQDVSSMDDFSLIELDTIVMGTVVSALWSLATELSLDIDVSTPEGMYIPARQRYSQIIQMWQQWGTLFKERMEHLNLGTGKLEIFWLRRVALMTGRLVPVYREREFDSRRPPKRLYPPIPYGEAATEVTPDRARLPTAEEIGRLSADIGWVPIGTTGADEVAVQDAEPTRESVVLWIDTDEP
jgi:hypothetical protein